MTRSLKKVCLLRIVLCFWHILCYLGYFACYWSIDRSIDWFIDLLIYVLIYRLCSAAGFYPDSIYEYFRVRVKHTGLVSWSFGGPIEISCPLDTTLYPFDRQRCRLLLSNWEYDHRQVDLRNASQHFLSEGHQDSGSLYIYSPQEQPKTQQMQLTKTDRRQTTNT